jgi:threonine/homoserine/homoserine lactone efflux protein
MDTNGYVAFLILGIVLVMVDAWIVYRSGRALLDEAYRDPRASRSMAQLVTVLFCLIVLGLLALISIIDVDAGAPVKTVVVKLGVVLLVLGLAHAATIAILSRMRDRLRDEQLTDELVEQAGPIAPPRHQALWQARLEEEARHPVVGAPIEDEPDHPYTSPA